MRKYLKSYKLKFQYISFAFARREFGQMRPRNNQTEENSIMNGKFYVKDHSSCLKGAANGKCNVNLIAEHDGLVTLRVSKVERESIEEDFAESIALKPNKWLVYLSPTVSHNLSLVLVKASDPSQNIVFEARNGNIAELKKMEKKLRECLKVIRYDIKVDDTRTKDKPIVAALHIMRSKLLLISGFPPNLTTLFEYKFGGLKNGMTLSHTDGLNFSELPNIKILSDQKDDMCRTIRGCIQAIGFGGAEENEMSRIACLTNGLDEENERSNSVTPSSVPAETTSDALGGSSCTNGASKDTEVGKCVASTKTQYVYYNLPTRPCKYIYMNLPNKRKAPQLNHDYINVYHTGSVYQNCWRSCTNSRDDDIPTAECPPPPPPRQKPPPLPPKPRNRPPNSPLPPIPTSPWNFPEPPPLPSRRLFQGPPPLPLPRLPERYVSKEIQYVVYSSKPVIGQMFVIQVVFFQNGDYATLERIKNLEEEANYQVLKPLPDCITVGSDLKISLVDIDDCCTLKSERDQVIEHEIVKEAILQSCWVIIEFHLEHNDNGKRNFHSKVVMRPEGTARRSSSRRNKEIQISTTFQDEVHGGLHTPTPLVCNSLKSIGVRKYLDICSLMDIPCALHNDWTGLAGEIGLTVDEVFKIQSKACFPNFSPTNEVLNIWSQRQRKSCNVDEFKAKLETLQRFDVLGVLDESDSPIATT